jgi:EmrB/QacA subfamily drug resistance transporter
MEAAAATASRSERLDRPTILALVAMGVAVLVVANDFTALSVALPAIEKDLDSDLGTVQWVINGYALVFGVMIVTGGRLADMFGRRSAFVAGALIFAGFSAVGGAAQDTTWLIACRALMAIGGALMWPAILGMTYAVLPDSKAGLAGGLILGAAGLGNAIGPLLGGVLTDELSWRWVFFVNLPIAAFGIAATLYAIKPDAAGTRERIDYRGIVTLSAGLVALLIALDQSSDWGWGDPVVIGLAAFCAVMLVLFALVESRVGERALVPRDVMGNRNFAAACLTVLLMSAVFFAALLYLPQFMTKSLGYSALRAGAGLLPMMATFAVVSFAAGSLYGRLGPKIVVSAGVACSAVGMLLLSFVDSGDPYSHLLPGLFILGTGVGLFYSSVTTAGVTALDPSRASLAGGIVYMFQIAGGSVGLGINTAIVLSGAGGSVSRFVDGIGDAFRVDAILAFCALAVSLLFVGGRVSAEALRQHRPHLHRAHPG